MSWTALALGVLIYGLGVVTGVLLFLLFLKNGGRLLGDDQ